MVTVVPSQRQAACGGVSTEQNSAGTWRDRDCTAGAGSCPSPAVWVLVPRDAGPMSLSRMSPAPPPRRLPTATAGLQMGPLQPWVAAHIPASSGLHGSVRSLTETRADVSDASLWLCFPLLKQVA